jgi:hypothetical protein
MKYIIKIFIPLLLLFSAAAVFFTYQYTEPKTAGDEQIKYDKDQISNKQELSKLKSRVDSMDKAIKPLLDSLKAETDVNKPKDEGK